VIEKLHDRAQIHSFIQIYIDGNFVGVLSRENSIKSLPGSASFGKRIQILVENQGRINFQENFDFKGILGNVTIQTFESPYYRELTEWKITGFPFDKYEKIEDYIINEGFTYQVSKNGWLREGPTLFYGELYISEKDALADTLADTLADILFINGFNLGRYWPLVGPQITMYIPKELLQYGKNAFVILELQKAAIDQFMNFTDVPNFMED
jgi:beta-galactosidase